MGTSKENIEQPMTFKVNLDPKGRILLPIKLRKKAGFREGDLLSIVLDSRQVAHISGKRQSKQSLKGIWKKARKGRSIVDELLAERKKEALNE